MKKYLSLMRCHHYVKNFIVFLPLFFSGQLLDSNLFRASAIGFLAFSFLSSFVYIMNDIKDVEKDRRHPTKRKRPIASGAVSRSQAIVLAIALMATAIALCVFGQLPWQSWIVLGGYLMINIAYSIGHLNDMGRGYKFETHRIKALYYRNAKSLPKYEKKKDHLFDFKT